MKLENLPVPVDAFVAKAVPTIMEALASFPDPTGALRRLLVSIAHTCQVTGSFAFLIKAQPEDDDVIQKICACLQYGCSSFQDAADVFNAACDIVLAAMQVGAPEIPTVTPSPAPSNPKPGYTGAPLEDLDDIIARAVRRALEEQAVSHSASLNAARAFSQNSLNNGMRMVVASHGQDCCPLVPQRVAGALLDANFAPYKWCPKAGELPGKFRAILAQMSVLLLDQRQPFEAVKEWSRRGTEDARLAAPEWVMINSPGLERQPFIELAACIISGNQAYYAAFVAARIEGADPTYLVEYGNGTRTLAGQPMFGAKAIQPTTATAQTKGKGFSN